MRKEWKSWFECLNGLLLALVLCCAAMPLALLGQDDSQEPLNVYLGFLRQQGIPTPAQLSAGSFVSVGNGTYEVSYSLQGLTCDIKEVRVALWQAIDEPTNRHYYVVAFLSLTPEQASSGPVSFAALQFGQSYAVHLSVMTAMPSIARGSSMPDEEIHLETITHVWPGGQNFQWSAADPLLPNDKDKYFSLAVSGGTNSDQRTFQAHRDDGTFAWIAGPTSTGTLLFNKSEKAGWDPGSVDALLLSVASESSGQTQSQILLVDSCTDCNPLYQAPSPEKTIAAGHLQVGVSNQWGGAIDKILMDQTGTRNLVESKNPGMLLQGAAWHLNYFEADPSHIPNGIVYNEGWEDERTVGDSGCKPCQPSCSPGDAKFRYNPTQAGEDKDGTHPCLGTNRLCAPGDRTCFPVFNYMPDNKTYISEQEVTVSGSNASYQSRYAAGFRPYDGVYNQWATENASGLWQFTKPYSKYQAYLWEQGTVSIETGKASEPAESGTIHITSQYWLAKQDSTGAAVHWPQAGDPVPDYFMQDRYFAGSRFFTQCYVYGAADGSPDNWGMVALTQNTRPSSSCSRDSPSPQMNCYGDYGWITGLKTPWTPYVMMSDALPSPTMYALLYSAQDSQYIYAVRSVAITIGYGSFLIDNDMGPELWIGTFFDNNNAPQFVLSTDAWTIPLNTYVILGPTEQAAMSELGRVSLNHSYPWNNRSISGSITGLPSGTEATISISGPHGSVSVQTVNGSFTVYGFYDGGTFTVTPNLSGYTFSPTGTAVSISGANQTGINFTATSAATYSISGTVSGAVTSGVTMKLTGASTASTTTGSGGTYTFSGLSNGSYTVTPSLSGYTFNPASTGVTISGANVTGVNFTATSAGPTFCLTLSVSNVEGGSITGATNGQCFASGTSVTLTAVPAAGYRFMGWTINGSPGGTTNPLTLVMNANQSVIANFKSFLPTGLAATDAHTNVAGQYQILLTWQADPIPGAQCQVSFRQPSAFAVDFAPWAFPAQSGSSYSVFFNPPLGCTDYVLAVRLYDSSTDQFGDWSNTVEASATSLNPTVSSATAFCDSRFIVLVVRVNWTVDSQEACAFTDFLVEYSDDGTNWISSSTVPATGATAYQATVFDQCKGAPTRQYRVTPHALSGLAVAPVVASWGSSPPAPPPPTQQIQLKLSAPNVKIADLTSQVAYDAVLQSAMFRGLGNGTFTDDSSILHTTAGDGDMIRIADMNGDGLLDRVVSHQRTLWVEYNSATSGFSAGASITLDEPISDFAIGYVPMNAVGGAPQVVAGLKDKVVLLSLSSSGWTITSMIPNTVDIQSLALGDMNNDGLIDILVGGKNGVYFYYVTAVSPSQWQMEAIASGPNVASVDIADANGDGFLDVAVGRQSSGDPLIYLYQRTPGSNPNVRPFPHTWVPGVLPAGFSLPNVRQVVFGDLDGSGLPGLFCATEQAQQSTYFKNDGAGGLLPWNLTLPGKVTAVAEGDFNGDGLLDFVAVGVKTLNVYTGLYTPSQAMNASTNQPPLPPISVQATLVGSNLILQWTPGSSMGTPPASLTYEVIAGTAPGVTDLYYGELGPANSSARQGNVRTLTTASVPFPAGISAIYWAVRTVSPSYQRSAWAQGMTYSDGTTEAHGETTGSSPANRVPVSSKSVGSSPGRAK